MKKKRPNTPANSLLADLKEYLLTNHIAQEEAARTIGVSYITMNRWMNGHTKKLTGLTVAAIRTYLGIKGVRV